MGIVWRAARERDALVLRRTSKSRLVRALVVSDIHGRVEAVKWLRSTELDRFDVIIFAGDILGYGEPRAAEIFDILATFNCPVTYIRGNWDRKLELPVAIACKHTHLLPLAIGSWWIVGVDEPCDSDSVDGDRKRLAEIVSELGSTRCVVVSHERLSFATKDMKGVPLFVFGHRHKFAHSRSHGSTFLNPGALGEIVTVTPNGEWVSPSKIRNAIVASYAIVELESHDEVRVTRKAFRQHLPGWMPLEGEKWTDAPILDAPFICA